MASLATALSVGDAEIGGWDAAGRQLWEFCCPGGTQIDTEAVTLLASQPSLVSGIANVLRSETASAYAKGEPSTAIKH